MREPSPMVLRRLLALRQFPVFATADLGELAIVADNLVEARFAAGATVAAPAARLPALHLILDGRIEVRASRAAGDAAARVRAWSAREAFGTLEVLARRPLGSAAIAVTETRTLRLVGSALRDLLEDNFSLLTGILHELARRLTAFGLPRTTAIATHPFRAEPLGLVERMIVLREHVPFLSSRLEPLAMLAHAAQELRWAAGSTIGVASERACDAFILLDGAIALEREGRPIELLGPGAAVGVLETLGALHHAATITTTVPTRALRIPSTTLFDALEEHAELALSVVETFAGLLLDVPRAHDAFRAPESSRSHEWPALTAHAPGVN